MRSEAELRRIHNIFAAVINGKTNLRIKEDDMKHFVGCANMLCHVLECDHNKSVEVNLGKIELELAKDGLVFKIKDATYDPERAKQSGPGANKSPAKELPVAGAVQGGAGVPDSVGDPVRDPEGAGAYTVQQTGEPADAQPGASPATGNPDAPKRRGRLPTEFKPNPRLE